MGHVNKISHVFTLSHVAELLGEDEDWLFEVADSELMATVIPI